MPRPIKPPTRPPVVAPIAAPLRAAIIGPAAMNGPTPGMARAPMPASKPSAPPAKPPLVAPAVTPSEAFVDFTWPKSPVPDVSGRSTEISEAAKPWDCNRSTMRSAWRRGGAIQNTDFDIRNRSKLVLFFVGRFDFELVIHFRRASRGLGEFLDFSFLLGAVHRTTQG